MTTTESANDFLFAGGSRSAKFEAIGDLVKGRILSAEPRQQTTPEGALKTWSDGKPMMQLVITLQTDLHDEDDDDGQRAVYAKGGKYKVASGKGTSMLEAIREAVKRAGAKGIDIGATLTVQHSGLGDKTAPAYSAPKLYVAKYEPGAAPVDIDLI